MRSQFPGFMHATLSWPITAPALATQTAADRCNHRATTWWAAQSGCAITLGGGELLNTMPYLFVLADNGGPTKTHAFLNYSPALDRANPAAPGSGGNACPSTDQRGEARADLRCDIGAYEMVSEGGAVVVSQALVAGTTVSFGPGMAAMTLNSGDNITGTVQRSDSDPIGFPPDFDELGVTWTITVTEGTGGGLLAPLAYNLDLSLCYRQDEVSGLNASLLQMYRREGEHMDAAGRRSGGGSSLRGTRAVLHKAGHTPWRCRRCRSICRWRRSETIIDCCCWRAALASNSTH